MPQTSKNVMAVWEEGRQNQSTQISEAALKIHQG